MKFWTHLIQRIGHIHDLFPLLSKIAYVLVVKKKLLETFLLRVQYVRLREKKLKKNLIIIFLGDLIFYVNLPI